VTDESKLLVTGEMRNIFFRARDEIIDGHDRVALRQQAIAHMRADKSGGSGN